MFQRLESNDRLERRIEGQTQNANEALNSLIWSKRPKTNFVTRRKIVIAVCHAVTEYNFGHT